MTHALITVLTLAGLCSGADAAGADPDGPRSAARPNILLAISDDQSWVHAGAYGCAAVQTPALDRVASEGVRFTQAFSAGPMCTVSRAALLTARNIWQNREAGTHWSVFPRDLVVYPMLLQDAGYVVGVTGKGWSPGNWNDPAGRPKNARLRRYFRKLPAIWRDAPKAGWLFRAGQV